MQDLLANPAVQGGVAPFIAGLIAAVLLGRFRLSGLAAVAAFATAVYFIAGFGFTPLSATRKIVLLGFAAPLAGMIVDFAFRPTRLGSYVLAIAGAAAAAWVFWPVLAQKDLARGLPVGATAVLAAAWTIAYSERRLAGDGVRAGASGLALGVGTGVAAIFGAALTYGLYGIAVAAGSGAFLLTQMITGKRSYAGATFTLSVTVAGGTSLRGGVGGPQRTLLGVIIITWIQSGLLMMGLGREIQFVILGVIAILMAVATTERGKLTRLMVK